MGGLLKFLLTNGPRIVKTIKFLFTAYKQGHEAGLWSEGHDGVVTETTEFEKVPTLGSTFGPLGTKR